MPSTRPPKKSETLEVRVPLEVKSAFMAHCRAEGRTASETLRLLMEGEMAAPEPAPTPAGKSGAPWRLLAAALAGLAVGAAAAPSLAHSAAACAPAHALRAP